jgi:hypothetical protein
MPARGVGGIGRAAVRRDLFEQLGKRPRGGEPERLDAILPRVLAIVRHVEVTEREARHELEAHALTEREVETRVRLLSTTRRAEALVLGLLEDGLDLKEVVDVCAEAFRIAGERAIERRYLGTTEP